jgi:hypothetical protein
VSFVHICFHHESQFELESHAVVRYCALKLLSLAGGVMCACRWVLHELDASEVLLEPVLFTIGCGATVDRFWSKVAAIAAADTRGVSRHHQTMKVLTKHLDIRELVNDTKIRRAGLLVGLTYPFVHVVQAQTPVKSDPSARAIDEHGRNCTLCRRYQHCFDASTYRGLAMLVADYLVGCADRQAGDHIWHFDQSCSFAILRNRERTRVRMLIVAEVRSSLQVIEFSVVGNKRTS